MVTRRKPKVVAKVEPSKRSLRKQLRKAVIKLTNRLLTNRQTSVLSAKQQARHQLGYR